MKLIVLLTMARWGYHLNVKTFSERVRISRAAARLVAYDNGFTVEFSYRTIARWDNNIYNDILSGKFADEIGVPNKGNRISLMKRTEHDHPGYLHELYRESVAIKGSCSSFSEISAEMNALSRRANDPRPSLDLNRHMVNVWFNDNNGREISSIEKPLDSEEHRLMRKDWVVENYGLLTCKYTY